MSPGWLVRHRRSPPRSGRSLRREPRPLPPETGGVTRVVTPCAYAGAWCVPGEGIAQKPAGVRTVGPGG